MNESKDTLKCKNCGHELTLSIGLDKLSALNRLITELLVKEVSIGKFFVMVILLIVFGYAIGRQI